MNQHTYYQEVKSLAREKREHYGVDTSAFGLREARKIYKAENITINKWPLPRKIKALYMCADNYYSVAIQENLPNEPKLFALVHELKHHYCDQEIIGSGVMHCGDYNRNKTIEIGAEVFAAEFIYPEWEFEQDINQLDISEWRDEDVVRFKRDCKAKISYQFICKRLEWLRFIPANKFKYVKFKNLEYELFGVPFYRQRQHKRA